MYDAVLTNPVNMVYNGYTIEPSTTLTYDPPELSKWDRFWHSAPGKLLAITLAVAALVVCAVTGNIGAFLATAGCTVGALLIGGAVSGYRSQVSGKGFWRGFESYITGNWAQSTAISATLLMVSIGIQAIAAATQNVQPLKDYELDPRSIAEAKQGNPSWRVFRERVWKNEAKYNKSAYSDKQLERIATGRAPKVDGKSMHLHHVFGKSKDMYAVIKLTPKQHILFHKTFGYHVNSYWNYYSIVGLFG